MAKRNEAIPAETGAFTRVVIDWNLTGFAILSRYPHSGDFSGLDPATFWVTAGKCSPPPASETGATVATTPMSEADLTPDLISDNHA